MKKLISILIFVLMSALVFAQASPTPVIGRIEINGNALSGYHIQVKNLDNTEASTITSNELPSLITENGLFVFDLGYLGRYDDGTPKYEPASRRYAGDRIEVRVVKDGQGNVFSCEKCVYTFNAPRSFPYQFEMKISDATITIKESCIELGCSSGYTCNRQTGTCEKVVVVEPKTEYVCSDGTKVIDSSLCPKEEETSDLYKALIALALILLGAFGWGKGFTALADYYYKKGQELEKQGKKSEAKKYYERAGKMLKTALVRAKEGKYR